MATLSPDALKRIQEAAARKWISSSDVLAKAGQLGIKTTQTQSIPQPALKQPIVSNAAQQGLQPWYALRNKPTVATPENPVRDASIQSGFEYDPNNPEDYLMKLNARIQTTGRKPSETEYYNAMLANKALSDKKAAGLENPYEQQLTELQAKIDAENELESGRDKSELDAYKNMIKSQYESQREEAARAGQKQKEAAQWVYSFSWFGRSTKAADTAVDIQRQTDQAIQAVNMAEQAAIAAKQAELEGASWEILKWLREEEMWYKKAAQDFQIESIKATAAANKAGWASYMESINNMMQTASKSWLNMDTKWFEQVALAMQWMTPEQKQEYLSWFSEQEQLLLSGLSWAMPTDTQTVWSWKNARTYQYNPKTQRYDIPVGSMWGGYGWGGWWGGGWTTPQANNMIGAIDDLLADPNLKLAIWPSLRKMGQNVAYWESQWRVADYQAKLDSFINQQVLPNLKLLKWSMSDKDIAFIKGASVPLNANMSEAGFTAALKNMRAVLNWEKYVNDAWVLVSWARPAYMKWTTKTSDPLWLWL